MPYVRLLALALLVLPISVGCGDGGPTGPTPQRASFVAQIDGVSWVPTNFRLRYSNDSLTVNAYDDSIGLAMFMAGPFDVGTSTTARAPSLQLSIRNAQGQFENWGNRAETATGSIAISRLSETTFSGTFDFKLENPEGSTALNGVGQKAIQGTFHGTLELADD